jgi:murein DD-endopeptidase MepM/ murein hydrolase activator NlpD
MVRPARFLASAAFLLAAACSDNPTFPGQLCVGYSDWATSPYVLPYAVGTSYEVIQGNCSPQGEGHRGANRYAYDFGMSIGTPITASRAGTVLQVEESHIDGEIAPVGFDNYLVILHADGTNALYGHLTRDGSAVAVGDVVAQGQLVAYSGNTGNTGGIPHLHVSVQNCDPVARGTGNCPSRPLTFSNTDPNVNGLVEGRVYQAK